MSLPTVGCASTQAKPIWKWQGLGLILCISAWSLNPNAFLTHTCLAVIRHISLLQSRQVIGFFFLFLLTHVYENSCLLSSWLGHG